MRAEYFIQNMIDMVKVVQRDIIVFSMNLDK